MAVNRAGWLPSKRLRNLEYAYRNAVYEVWLECGYVKLKLDAIPQCPISIPQLAIVTAYNPGVQRPSQYKNKQENAKLKLMLEMDGWRVWKAQARDIKGAHAEPSYAVVGMRPEVARRWGARFNQAAVFIWDGDKGNLIWCWDTME